MLELLLCSLLTIFPDYLYRRYRQGKRLGKEINLFSVWFELRWGIVSCVMLTIAFITVIFYYHPTSTNVTSYFRTVPIAPEHALGGALEPGDRVDVLGSFDKGTEAAKTLTVAAGAQVVDDLLRAVAHWLIRQRNVSLDELGQAGGHGLE